MDYNVLKSRLNRTLHSFESRYDEDIDKFTKVEKWKYGQGISLIFGTENDEETINKVMSILHNLSSLKDHIKNSLKKKGLDANIVEKEIDNSLHLQVLIDIVNQEKHGSPLKRPRSNKNPKLDHRSNSFRLGRKGEIGTKEMTLSEDGDIISDEFSPTMFIDALIKDEKGNLLFRLDELIETCYEKWNDLIKKYNCS